MNLQDKTWLPCINARNNGIDVYGTVNAVETWSVDVVRTRIQQLVNNFGGSINGVHFTNPGPAGYITTHWNDIFDYARTANMLVSIEGYGEVYNMNVINKVDRIVNFRDDLTNFPSDEPQLSQTFQNELIEAIEKGLVKDTKFAQLIFYVGQNFLNDVHSMANTRSLIGL